MEKLLEIGSIDRELSIQASVQLGSQTLLDQILLGCSLEEKMSQFESKLKFIEKQRIGSKLKVAFPQLTKIDVPLFSFLSEGHVSTEETHR